MNLCVPVRGVESSSAEEQNAAIRLVAWKCCTFPRASPAPFPVRDQPQLRHTGDLRGAANQNVQCD